LEGKGVSVPLERRRIIITGGAGFIGYHLALRLSQESGNEITLVDNFARGKLDEDLQSLVVMPNVELISADLTQLSSFDQLGRGYDEVYHLAAVIGVDNVLERPHEVVRVNAVTTLLLLDWFVQSDSRKLLFSSTSEAYAWTQQFYELPIPTPEDVPLALTDLSNRRSSYAGSKIFGELAITQYCNVYNLPFVIVRYHNVYGPRMGYAHVIPELHSRALDGQDPLVVFSADHSRAFCYVTDAVEATIKAMREPAADGRTINIGNDQEEVTIGQLAKKVLETAQINAGIARQQAENDPIVRRCPDISRARRLLDYEPHTMLDEGLDLTLNWYTSHPSS
jgi:UDP-glucose 4-epimerase/UDP-glucuronate decarboxylase